jgi:signal transduction histidine kinase
MNSDYLEQLQSCCRDQAAFERMQQILTMANSPQTGASDQNSQLERHQVLFRVVAKIRETLDLETIFQTAATEVQQSLQADRVGVFRFYPDSGWNAGEFVSEAVKPEFPSALAARVQDHCFGDRYACHYQQGRVQAVADIHAAGLEPCHVEVLARFQVRANLIVPLLQGEALWGLLCIHQCAAPRDWQPEEIEFVTQIATQLAVALKQAELLTQTQQQTQNLVKALEQLRMSQAQLIQSEKLSGLGQLVAGIAHEINNPVNFICGNLTHASHYVEQILELLSLYQQECSPTAALSERLADLDLEFIAEDFPKLLDSMKVGSDRIRQLVLSLRNFARTDAVAMQPINLHDGIDSTLLILQHRLKPKADSLGIELVCEYGQLSPVECYASQINQVFMNLISNAIDALEEAANSRHQGATPPRPKPQIKIRTMQIPDPQGGNPRAVVCIADNGPGIPAEIQDKLFDPFFTTKPAGKGTGLGLSISYDIVVNRHGGEIQCYSPPDGGTEFWIELPVQQSPEAARPTATIQTVQAELAEANAAFMSARSCTVQ